MFVGERFPTKEEAEMPRYDEDDDDGYDRARDAFLTGDSDVPVTRRQRQEVADERDWWNRYRR